MRDGVAAPWLVGDDAAMRGSRSGVVAAIVSSAVLLMPAVAAGAQPVTTLSFTAPVAKGFELNVSASEQAGGLALSLDRKRSGSTESVRYGFPASGTATATANLSRGRMEYTLSQAKTVSMRFRATGKVRRGPLAKGCTGPDVRVREGVFEGAVRLVIDKKYFRTIKLQRAPGRIVVAPGEVNCGPPTPDVYFTYPELFVFPRDGHVEVKLFRFTQMQPVSIEHSVTARLPASAFSVAPDHRSFVLRGSGLLSGTATFEATAVDERFGEASGPLTGELSARLPGIGVVSPLRPGVLGTLYF